MSETVSLQGWIQRQIKAVEEDGESVARFVLVAGDGGAVFDTLHAPFRLEDGGPGAEKLAALLEEVIEQSREIFPAKKQTMVTVQAESGKQNILARWQKMVIGKNASSAGNGLLSSSDAATAAVMNAFAETMKTILASANTQIAVLTKSLEGAHTQALDLLELRREEKAQSALENEENHTVQQKLLTNFAEYAPQLANAAIEAFGKGKPS
jgi:hypothetical protein